MRISKTQHVYLHNLAQRVWILYPFLQNRRSTHFTVHPWLSVLFKHMRSRPSFKLRCSIAGDNGSETGAGQTNVFVSPLTWKIFQPVHLPTARQSNHSTQNKQRHPDFPKQLVQWHNKQCYPRTHPGPPKIWWEIVSPYPPSPSSELDGLCQTRPGHTLESMECWHVRGRTHICIPCAPSWVPIGCIHRCD